MSHIKTLVNLRVKVLHTSIDGVDQNITQNMYFDKIPNNGSYQRLKQEIISQIDDVTDDFLIYFEDVENDILNPQKKILTKISIRSDMDIKYNVHDKQKLYIKKKNIDNSIHNNKSNTKDSNNNDNNFNQNKNNLKTIKESKSKQETKSIKTARNALFMKNLQTTKYAISHLGYCPLCGDIRKYFSVGRKLSSSGWNGHFESKHNIGDTIATSVYKYLCQQNPIASNLPEYPIGKPKQSKKEKKLQKYEIKLQKAKARFRSPTPSAQSASPTPQYQSPTPSLVDKYEPYNTEYDLNKNNNNNNNFASYDNISEEEYDKNDNFVSPKISKKSQTAVQMDIDQSNETDHDIPSDAREMTFSEEEIIETDRIQRRINHKLIPKPKPKPKPNPKPKPHAKAKTKYRRKRKRNEYEDDILSNDTTEPPTQRRRSTRVLQRNNNNDKKRNQKNNDNNDDKNNIDISYISKKFKLNLRSTWHSINNQMKEHKINKKKIIDKYNKYYNTAHTPTNIKKKQFLEVLSNQVCSICIGWTTEPDMLCEGSCKQWIHKSCVRRKYTKKEPFIC